MAAKAQLVVDVTAQPIRAGDAALVADACGVLYWPRHSTLLVADLHLEKGAHFAGRGAFLPPYDTRETLRRLAGAITRYQPERVIALGDNFHAVDGPYAIGEDDLAALHALQRDREWIWIAGNHDPVIATCAGGRAVDEIEIDGLMLRHAPSDATGVCEIAGHLHPVARMSGRGMTVRRRCFIGDGSRVVMPAFGAFTGGLNVLDAAFSVVFGARPSLSVLMLGDAGLYPVPLHHLRPF